MKSLISSYNIFFQVHNDIPFFFSNITRMLESCRERQTIVASHGMRREEGKKSNHFKIDKLLEVLLSEYQIYHL